GRFVPPVELIAALSGVATFALQILWNRAFAQVHENSMYAFAMIAAAVILALAIGGQGARLALAQAVSTTRIIGVSWVIGGGAVLAAPVLMLRLTNGLSYLPTGGDWSATLLRLAGLATVIVMPPMILLGAVLPAL